MKLLQEGREQLRIAERRAKDDDDVLLKLTATYFVKIRADSERKFGATAWDIGPQPQQIARLDNISAIAMHIGASGGIPQARAIGLLFQTMANQAAFSLTKPSLTST